MNDVELISLERISTPAPSSHPNNLKSFSSNFWGDKTLGFDILCQNLRTSLASVKELEAYIGDTLKIEDVYSKQLGKLSAQIGRYSNESSVSPLWHNVMKETCERNSKSHHHFYTRLTELQRDVQAYGDELRKKRKRMKEVEARTASMVEQFRSAKSQLHRARDNYMALAADSERPTRRGTLVDMSNSFGSLTDKNISSAPLQQSSSASSASNFPLGMMNSTPKIDKKLQQAIDEYKQVIERYNGVREDYVRLFTDSCHSFQSYEEAHVQQMSKFALTYSQHLEQLNEARRQTQSDMKLKLDNVYSVDQLIQQFLAQKGTGHELPEVGEFVEYAAGIVNDVATSTPISEAGSTFNFLTSKKPSVSTPGRKLESKSPVQSPNQVFDPFEMAPTPRATTPNSELPLAARKRTATDNRLFGLINFEFFGKIMSSNNGGATNSATSTPVMRSRRNREGDSGIGEPQLIDLDNGENISAVDNDDERQSRSREMFQKAKPMRIIAKVGGKSKKKRQNSLPSSETDKFGDEKATGEAPVDEQKSGSLITATSMNIANPLVDDDDDFDDSAFDNLKTKGITPDNTLDDDDDFFRQIQQIKSKKKQTIGRQDSADMNNFYESSLGSNESKNGSRTNRGVKIDRNNNFTTDLFRMGEESTKSLSPPLTTGDEHSMSDSSSDDDDSDDSDEPKRIFVQIKPVGDTSTPLSTTTDMELSLIGKSLKLTTTPTSANVPIGRRMGRALSPPPPPPPQSASDNQPLSKSIDDDSLSVGINLMKLKQTHFGPPPSVPTHRPPPPQPPRPAPPLPPPPTNLKLRSVYQPVASPETANIKPISVSPDKNTEYVKF